MSEPARPTRPRFGSSLYARRNPYPLMMWLAITGSTIIFLFLIGMLMMRQSIAPLGHFPLPRVLWISTGLIVVSSVTLELSRHAYRAEQYRAHLTWLGTTLMLGLTFLLCQLVGGWQLLADQSLGESQAAAYLFVLAGLHFAHMLAGVALLFWTLIDATRHKTYVEGFIQSLNPGVRTRQQLASTFWHFIDGLWVALVMVLWALLH